jgi:hypothetical protein
VSAAEARALAVGELVDVILPGVTPNGGDYTLHDMRVMRADGDRAVVARPDSVHRRTVAPGRVEVTRTRWDMRPVRPGLHVVLRPSADYLGAQPGPVAWLAVVARGYGQRLSLVNVQAHAGEYDAAPEVAGS